MTVERMRETGKDEIPRKTEEMITAADALTFVEHARDARKRLRHEKIGV